MHQHWIARELLHSIARRYNVPQGSILYAATIMSSLHSPRQTRAYLLAVRGNILSTYAQAGRSGPVVSASACGVRGTRFGLSRLTLWYAALGAGCALTTVPMSSQPCIPSGSLNRVPASARVRRECQLCRVAGNTVIPYGTWVLVAVRASGRVALPFRAAIPRLLTLLCVYFIQWGALVAKT